MKINQVIFVLTILLAAVGCRGAEVEVPTVPAAPSTAPLPTNTLSAPTDTPQLADTVTPPPPVVVTPTTAPLPSTPEPSPTWTPAPAAEAVTYAVIYVEPDDILNVRTGPGVENEVAGTLPPDAIQVEISGDGAMVDEHLWVPIAAEDVNGWVNNVFLTEQVEPEAFCQGATAVEMLDALTLAISTRDGEALAQLVHPERGLRLRISWWNPEVWIQGEDLKELFISEEDYEWGIEDGSGRAIEGSFADTILPLLEEDLITATEVGCNTILHGNTAGLVQLPELYEAANYYSLYQPPEDASGFDWGTWVVGIERWQGQYYISFLVHFEWEI